MAIGRRALAFEHAEEIGDSGEASGWTFAFCSPNRELRGGTAAPGARRKRSLNLRSHRPQLMREVQERLHAPSPEGFTSKTHGHGKVIIEYARLEDFDGLLEQLAGE